MLFTPKQSYAWQVSNMTGTWVDATFVGTTTPCGTNSKGAWSTALLSNTANDAFAISVCMGLGGVAGAAYGYLIDIGVDPANGTNYQVLIPDLLCSAGSATLGGMWWWFPLYIPKGSSIAARASVNTGTTAIRVGVELYGQPKRLDNIAVGSFVRTFNIATSTSFGTTGHTEGASGVQGSYTASVGTTSDRLWFWQAGLAINNTAWTKALAHMVDVAVGDASNKYLVVENMVTTVTDSEKQANCNPQQFNYFEAPSGVSIYVRGRCTGAALATAYASVHAVGG